MILLSQRREKILFKLEQILSRTKVPNYTEKVPDRIQHETRNKVNFLPCCIIFKLCLEIQNVHIYANGSCTKSSNFLKQFTCAEM